ncbi:MAG: MerR family transcriptional regulator [Pseudomonadota bacterium]|nr:MerR family transcriptional regulator [Pseudomonadota bacterium]
MAVAKSAEAFRTISEAAAELDVPQHVLRHWEEVFGQIRPMRRAGGRRYYRPIDIDILRGVRVLLYDERYTTRGVQKIFKENGVKYIAELGRLAAAGQTIELRPLLDEDSGDRLADGADPETGSATGEAASMSPEVRKQLSGLLARLEKVQELIDEATLAIEAIDAEIEEKNG